MQAETSPETSAPVFEQLVAEGGNPLGAHQDMPRPRFNLGVPITDWPRLDDPSGEFPTMEIPAVQDTRQASALAQLDNGETTIEPPEPTQE